MLAVFVACATEARTTVGGGLRRIRWANFVAWLKSDGPIQWASGEENQWQFERFLQKLILKSVASRK